MIATGRRGALLALLAIGVLAGDPHHAAAADPVTLRIEGPGAAVPAGDTFEVGITLDASVPTTGAQVNLTFDPAQAQVVDVTPGAAYAGGILAFGSADDGSNASVEALVARANATGELRNVAVFFLPGSGLVPPGKTEFLLITMRAIDGSTGPAALGLDELDASPIQVLDEAGTVLPVTTSGAEVAIEGSTGSAGATATPVATASARPPAPAGSVTVRVSSPGVGVPVGDESSIDLLVEGRADLSSVVVDLAFDPALLQVTKLEVGEGWGGATLIAGTAGASAEATLAEVNRTGTLAQVGVFRAPGPRPPAASAVFLRLTVTGLSDGTTALTLAQATVLDVGGVAIEAVLASSQLAVGTGTAPLDPTSLLPLALAVLLVIGVGAVLIAARRSGRNWAYTFRRWPLVVSLLLALVPVAAFGGIVVTLVVNSLPVLTRPGLEELLGFQYASRFSGINLQLFGLLPALGGTILIAAVALLIAVPVSLALAIVATEFPFGPVGRIIRPLVGILAGIPPIVYAVSGVVFVTLFMIPKFAADSTFPLDPTRLGYTPETWPPEGVPYSPGAYPWDPAGTSNSTLLGGILIALLVIPFLTPLLADAIRNVPNAAREASLALGANRTHTLRRVILPVAMPGMIAGVALATLKAMGDTLIVIFAVGWEANRLPEPIVDVLERTPSLAAQGAGLLGGFQVAGGAAGCVRVECGVGYASALMLLVLAALIVLGMAALQSFTRRGSRG